MLYFLLFLVVGFFIGFIFARKHPKQNGLFIVQNAKDKTYWKLDVNFDPDDICNRKYLTFRVITEELHD